MNSKQIAVGTKIEFLGDMANDPFIATVTRIEGAWMWFQRSTGPKHGPEPVALVNTPRWKVVG